LNSYELTLTTPSRWRVYRFHHLGTIPCSKGNNHSISFASKLAYNLIWQEWEDSNPRPAVLETAALPTELHSYPNRDNLP
jgi:hypothetical protein